MRVHVVPAGDKYSRKNHKNTVSKNVSINVIKRFITDKNILNLLNADSYAIWGVTNGKSNVNHTKWLRMKNDDICLFYRDRHFFTSCKVISKFKMRDFSIHLWGFKKDKKNIDSNETWENMFILDEIQKINIPVSMFNKFMKFKVNNVVQKYQDYDESTSQKIIDEFELYDLHTLSNYDVSLSEKEREKWIQNQLNNIGDTDLNSSGGHSRKEQSLHREHHFGGKETSKCSLCHRELPITLLHAGHIKPRRNCNDEERKDLNVTMPVCKLGCDDLFEKGYIFVDASGFIIINNKREISSELQKFLKIYNGKKCLHFNEKTKDYFKSKNKDVLQ